MIGAVPDHALEICEAEFGALFEYHGDLRFGVRQSRNLSPEFARGFEEQGIFAVDAGTGLGRVVTNLTTINILDVRAEGIYRDGAPLRIATADLGRARSFVAIPIIWGDRLPGAFTVYLTRVHPFSERTLELAQLFADQAAIAIENARVQACNAADVGGGGIPGQSTGRTVLPLLAILPFRPSEEGDATACATGRRLASSTAMELVGSPPFRLIDQASSFSPRLRDMTP